MNVACVIPARYGSTRLPAKALIEVRGLPICMWVYNRAVESGAFSDVAVATDDERIMQAVVRHGGRAVLTSVAHASGTDRVNEAVQSMSCSHVVNLQGDEPLIPLTLLREIAGACATLDDKSLLTCATHGTISDSANPNVVKVVCNVRGEALYFSRAAIPFNRDGAAEPPLAHVGIYAFTRLALARFCALGQGTLERLEKLEQLRALENGMTIHCLVRDYRPLGIDTAEDLDAFRNRLEETSD